MRRGIGLLGLFFCLMMHLDARTRNEIEDSLSIFSLFAHSTSQADLREHFVNHAIWSDAGYIQQSSKISSIGSVVVGGGYDYVFGSKRGQNVVGFGIEYGYSSIDGATYKSRSSHLVALHLRDMFLHQSGFYFQTLAKYAYLDQRLQDAFSASMLLAGLELGYRKLFGKTFFIQPLLRVSSGYVFSLGGYVPIFLQSGGNLGLEFYGGLRGDVHLGVFFDSDMWVASRALRDDYRILLKLGSNLHFSKRFRLFLGAQTSFLGRRNMDYGASLGIRILLGQESSHHLMDSSNSRNLKSVQQDLLYQAELSRQRFEEKHHLKPQELENRYEIQQKRDSGFVQEETKYAKRQRLIRESSTWVDTRANQRNYANRTPSLLRSDDIKRIKSYQQREIERKYGKLNSPLSQGKK